MPAQPRIKKPLAKDLRASILGRIRSETEAACTRCGSKGDSVGKGAPRFICDLGPGGGGRVLVRLVQRQARARTEGAEEGARRSPARALRRRSGGRRMSADVARARRVVRIASALLALRALAAAA